MTAGNTNLRKARRIKNDAFFTQLADIEAELSFYRNHFRNRMVYCNCDDPAHSQFLQYFRQNFDTLELKGIAATHYSGGGITQASLWDTSGHMTWPISSGDFRSAECMKILRDADIVVTNPPFSLWREFMAALTACRKKFLIVGPLNAITYKEVFPLLRDNKLWLGNTQIKSFLTPDNRIQRFGNVYWFTNLDHPQRHTPLTLHCSYNPQLYPQYANYDAIEVSKTANIPYNYDGIMGVPISFLTRYCPEQFEILGLSSTTARNMPDDLPKHLNGGIRFYLQDQNGHYRRMYERLVIRKQHPCLAGGNQSNH